MAIIIATWGVPKWADLALARALPSARAQDPQELILIDSADGDAATVRNAGARAANADWLCFLDADDELAPGFLQAMEPYLKHTMLLAPYAQYVDQQGHRAPPLIPNAGHWPHLNDAVSGTLVPRELFEQVGGWRQEFWPWPDWELWLRCVAAGVTKVHVPDAVYVVHDTPNSANKSLSKLQATKLHANVRKLYPEQFAKS